jgi:hypothetical protein
MMSSGINEELPIVGLTIASIRAMFLATEYLSSMDTSCGQQQGTGTAARNVFAGIIHESRRTMQPSRITFHTRGQNLILTGSHTTGVTVTYLV